jgi:hypothetical protein
VARFRETGSKLSGRPTALNDVSAEIISKTLS